MKDKHEPISGLQMFIPPGTYEFIVPYLQQYQVQITIKKERKNVLGDYINPIPSIPYHRISINGNLNAYSFLITLLHELAHLVTFVQYKHSVSAHGAEWKYNFKKILLPFLQQQRLPQDIHEALQQYIQNVKATTCGDVVLYKALARYNHPTNSHKKTYFVDELPMGSFFKTPKDGKIYKKENKRRTRYLCIEWATKLPYLFPGIYEVELMEDVS